MTPEQEASLVNEAHRMSMYYKRAERAFDRQEIGVRECRERKLAARNRFLEKAKAIFNAPLP